MCAMLVGYLVGYVVALATLIQFYDGAVSAVACCVAGIAGAAWFRRRSIAKLHRPRID